MLWAILLQVYSLRISEELLFEKLQDFLLCHITDCFYLFVTHIKFQLHLLQLCQVVSCSVFQILMSLLEMIYYALLVILNAIFATISTILGILIFEELIDFGFAVVRIEFRGLDEDIYVAHIECTLF